MLGAQQLQARPVAPILQAPPWAGDAVRLLGMIEAGQDNRDRASPGGRRHADCMALDPVFHLAFAQLRDRQRAAIR